MAAKIHAPARRRKEDSHVGIFWLISGGPLIDSTPLSEAEPYGDFLTHSRGHAAVWEKYQRNGLLPQEMEYEEPPRGRVMYNTKTHQFTMLADLCIFILRRKALVTKIKKKMGLPKNTEVGGDMHYRCFNCLRGEAR